MINVTYSIIPIKQASTTTSHARYEFKAHAIGSQYECEKLLKLLKAGKKEVSNHG